MPDNNIPLLNSPFLSNDSILALQVDTANRFNLVHNSVGSEPMPYPMPSVSSGSSSYSSQSQLLNNSYSKGSLNNALNSPDIRVRNKAADLFRYKTTDNPATYGIGVPRIIQYDPVMDKYINGKFGYAPSLGIEGNEERYYRDYLSQNIFEKTLTNTGVFLGRLSTGIAAKTVATFGYMGSMIKNGIDEMIDPTGNNAMADIANNSLSRWAEVNWEENWKNSAALSVFKPSDWEERGFWSKLGNAAFWTDEIADGAAFMGEMILSTYLTGGVGKLAGLSKFGATGINTASKLSRIGAAGSKVSKFAGGVGKAIDWTLKIGTGADDIAGIGRWAFLTTSESAVESSQKYRTEKEEMYRRREAGDPKYVNKTDFEIETDAGTTAATVFRGNMAILAASNAIENRFIFGKMSIFKSKRPDDIGMSQFGASRAGAIAIEGAEKGAAKATKIGGVAEASLKQSKYSTKLGKYFDWKNSLGRAQFYGKMLGRSLAVEGLWEENAQLAVERLSSHKYFTQMGFPSQFGGILSKSVQQMFDAFTGKDLQAQTAIGLGAIIGIGGGGLVTKAFGGEKFFRGERKQIKMDTEEAIKKYEFYRTRMFSFLDMWKKDKDGKYIKENGKLVLDEVAAEAVLTSLYSNLDLQYQIDEIQNPAVRQHMMDQMMQQYVWAAKKAGIFERAIDSINRIKDYTPEEALELGFDPDSMLDHTQVIDNLNKVGKVYDEVFNDPRNKTYTDLKDRVDEENRKYWNFTRRSNLDSLQRTLDQFTAEENEEVLRNLSFDDPGRSRSDLRELNSLRLRLLSLEELEEGKLKFLKSDYAKTFSENVAKEKQKIKERIDKIYSLYEQDIKDGKLIDLRLLKSENEFVRYKDGKELKILYTAESSPDPLLNSMLRSFYIKGMKKISEIENSISFENFHNSLIDSSNDENLENYRIFKKYMEEEGELIQLTMTEDRIAQTKEIISELESKDTLTDEEKKQLEDHKKMLVELEKLYQEQVEKRKNKEEEKTSKQEEAKEKESAKPEKPAQTEQEKEAKEKEAKEKEEKQNQLVDNIINKLKTIDLENEKQELNEDTDIFITNQLKLVTDFELAKNKIINFIETLEGDLKIKVSEYIRFAISNPIFDDVEELDDLFIYVTDIIDKKDTTKDETLSDIEIRKQELRYSIAQLEENLKERTQDFINKGATPEEASRLAYEEFPQKDKDALEKLKRELDALEKAKPEEEEEEKQQEPEIITDEELVKELDELEKQNTKAPTTPVSDEKADIPLGKVGNTEYEVKANGVYYQGKKLDNPENKTSRQLIEADIERRRQEDIDKLFEKTQTSVDKKLNTPVEKISKEEITKRIEEAKEKNKDLITELENPEFLNSKEREEEWDKKAYELSDKLPRGISWRVTDGKIKFFDNQDYREEGFGTRTIVPISVFSIHNKSEKFEVGDKIQVDDGIRALPATVTKVNENGKILEARQDDGRLIISKGNIITTAPINERIKIDDKYNAELAALEGAKPSTAPTTNIEAEKQKLIEERDQRIKEEAPQKDVFSNTESRVNDIDNKSKSFSPLDQYTINRYESAYLALANYISSFNSLEEAFDAAAKKADSRIYPGNEPVTYRKIEDILTRRNNKPPTKKELYDYVFGIITGTESMPKGILTDEQVRNYEHYSIISPNILDTSKELGLTKSLGRPAVFTNIQFIKQVLRWTQLRIDKKTNRSLEDFLKDTQKEIRDEYQQKIDSLEGATPTISSEKKFEDLKRGDYFIFQLDEHQVEAVNRDQKTGEPISIEARNQYTGDVTTITKEEYEDEVGPIEEQTVPGERFGDFLIRQKEDGTWGIFNLKGESLGLNYGTKDEAIAEIAKSEEEKRREETTIDPLLDINIKQLKSLTEEQRNALLDTIAKDANQIVYVDGKLQFDPNKLDLTRSLFHPNIIDLANKKFPQYKKIAEDYMQSIIDESKKDPVSDEEWIQFRNGSSPSIDTLTNIAKKYREDPNSLSKREGTIFNAKKNEIESIIKSLINENKESGIIPVDNTNADYQSQENDVSKFSDQAKSDGIFTFVTLGAQEVLMDKNDKPVIENDVIQTKAAGIDKEAIKHRRHRNVIDKYSDELEPLNFTSEIDGKRQFRLQIMIGNKNNADWFIQTSKKGSPLIAVIVNQDGKILNFDENGNIVKSGGIPVAFEFSTAEYSSRTDRSEIPNILLTRESIMLGQSQNKIPTNTKGGRPVFDEMWEKKKEEAIRNNTEIDFDPTGDIVKLIARGVQIYADFNLTLNSKLSSSRINNNYSIQADPGFENTAKTVQELIELGFLDEESNPIIRTGILYYEDANGQTIKNGAPYFPVPNSKLTIPLFGKRIKDLTINGERIYQSEDGKQKYAFGAIIDYIQQKKFIFTDPLGPSPFTKYRIEIEDFRQKRGEISTETFSQMFDYIRELFYSEDIEFVMETNQEDVPIAMVITDKRAVRTDFSEYRINMNKVEFEKKLQSFVFADERFNRPGSKEIFSYPYSSFVNENFVTNSLPANVGTQVNFVKLNRRVIFTLENSYPEIQAKLQNNISKDNTAPEEGDPQTEETIKSTSEGKDTSPLTNDDNIESIDFGENCGT